MKRATNKGLAIVATALLTLTVSVELASAQQPKDKASTAVTAERSCAAQRRPAGLRWRAQPPRACAAAKR